MLIQHALLLKCSILSINKRAIYTRMKKKKSEFHVNMHYNLQPVHKHLTLCVQWNGNFVEQSVQDVLVLSFTESFFKKPSF